MNIHTGHDHDFPDAGQGTCCMGAAAMGPGRCTCWEPVYDREQQPIQPGPMPQRARLCVDCAFRNGSPERSGNGQHAHSGEGEIEAIIAGSRRFVCHQGMRRITHWRHPSGVVVACPTDGAYRPPEVGGIAYQASGEPAHLCAGVHAMRMGAAK